MKTTNLIFLFFISLFSYGQTKQETVAWLNSKLSQNRPVEFDQHNNLFETQITKINTDVSFIVKSSKLKSQTEFERLIVGKGFLKDADMRGVTIELSTGGKYLYLILTCSNAECFRQMNISRKINNENGPVENSYDKSSICIGVFSSSEKDLAERCKKAVIHLISLFGGSKEPF